MSTVGIAEPSRTAKEAFARDLDALREEIDASLSHEDYLHLRRFVVVARMSTLVGYGLAWPFVNPIAVLLLSVGQFVRWAVVAHHVLHRGYDRVPGTPARYTSRSFARGWRRFVDWLDWIPPEGWRYEHNTLHHSHTNEEADPDFVERNTFAIWKWKASVFFKYFQIAFFALTWKALYYMPTVIRTARYARARRERRPSPHDTPRGVRQFYNLATREGRQQWWELLGSREYWFTGPLPYGLTRFVLIPGLFLVVGRGAALNVLVTTVIAELLTNLHSFIMIVPNHTGEDLMSFEQPAGSRSELLWRQVVASVNYTSPGAWSDFLQGGLNFQIEHHLWPDLPLSKYRTWAPRVREVCARHGIPYREQPVTTRVRMLTEVLLGRKALQREPVSEESATSAA